MREFAMPAFAMSGSSWNDTGEQHTSASIEDSNSSRELDRRLDQALEDTFPASDALSIVMPIRNG